MKQISGVLLKEWDKVCRMLRNSGYDLSKVVITKDEDKYNPCGYSRNQVKD